MTTINNLTIEQMREIVDGAPEGAHLWRDMDSICSPNEILYYAWFGGALLVFEEGKGWIKSIYHDGSEYILDQLQELNNLRTAIAKHDEFKAGDFVVLTATGTKDVLLKIIDHKYTNDLHRVKIVKTASCGPIHKDQIRHATLEEIKAGHRIDDTTDHVTDIRNHVSPNTRVVDL